MSDVREPINFFSFSQKREVVVGKRVVRAAWGVLGRGSDGVREIFSDDEHPIGERGDEDGRIENVDEPAEAWYE